MTYYTVLPECYSVYLVIFTICASPEGCLSNLWGEDTLLVHPIEVYPYNSLVLGLKVQWNAVAAHTCIKLCHFSWHCLHTCMSSDQYFSLLFWGLPPLMVLWEHPYDIIRGGNPSPIVISFGTNSNTPLFIWFNPYSKTISAVSYMYQFSYWLDK